MTRRLGAIDVGTNSVRLLVADVTGKGRAARLRTVDRRMRITRLGQGVDANRRLHPDAIERTLAVFREYRSALDELGVESVRAGTTSASRDATNREELFGPAAEVLGHELELISGEEEAELSFAGATADLEAATAPPPYLVVDIGGGSTELVVGTEKPEGLVSVDVGCVRLTEQFLASDPPTPEELSNAVMTMRDHLADVDREVPAAAGAATVVGLAGTVTNMAAIDLGLPEYDPERIHHHRLTRPAAEEIFRTLALEPVELRRQTPGLEPGRVDVIVGGAIVLVSILRHYDADAMLVSEADILDGLVRSLG
ncbi:MAG: Ppx/GppA phosphatase family protein [Acidimicrobiia bacterium]